jgi:hypothetical protein
MATAGTRRRQRRNDGWRRTKLAGVAVGVAILATAATSGSSGAQTGFNNGTGSANAQTIRVNPVSGGLSFGIGIGEALAGHQNTVGTAESRSANLGVIGTTLAGEGCDGGEATLPEDQQPGSLRTDSTEDGAGDGIDDQDPVVPGVDRHVLATSDPYAEARTTSQGIDIPGVLHVGPTVAVSASGVAGELREAIAITEIGEVTAGGGMVELRGLRWEAIHRSGSEEAEEGTFSIGSATIAGTPIPTDDPTEALAEVNAVLNPLGLTFRPPTHHVDQTSRGSISTVDPLEIALVPSDGRSAVLDPVVGGLQPVRSELFSQLIEQDCGNATYVTVLDIVLNATGSGGEVGIQLGGVRATTAPLTLFSGLGQLPPLPPLSSLSPSSPGGRPGSLGSSGSTGGTGSSGGAGGATGAASPAGTETANAQPVSDVLPGTTGGPMLAVSAAGLGLLAATAEGDRRKMRRAQREIPVDI